MDFRDYLKLLNAHGMIKNIDHEVQWKYEIGDISRKNKKKAILFNKIHGYNEFKLFTGGFSSYQNIALLFGLPIDSNRKSIVKEIQKRVLTSHSPKLTEVNKADYISRIGKDVNLYELPVPWWHRSDGGRYIGTWHINVSNDPVSGRRNIGVYRMQIKGRNYATVNVSPLSHFAQHIKNAEKEKKDLPTAVVIGVNEVIVMAAAANYPYGKDEYNLAGAMSKKSVLISKCSTIDIDVPADAEIILEGVIRNGVRLKDGPFYDYSGKINVNPNALCFEVHAIRAKRDAIFRGMAVGAPGAEDHLLFSILSKLNLVDFHGSLVRQKIQNYFLEREMYRLFQLAGNLGSIRKVIRS